jgi:serine/threonine protein kinase
MAQPCVDRIVQSSETGSLPATTLPAYPFLQSPQTPDELGRLGSYRILGSLGAGGMGVLFVAEDIKLHREVALKIMQPRLAQDAAARARFIREAKALAAFSHDHIVAIHQVGDEDAIPYIVMPLLRGETLADRLKREIKLLPSEVLRIGREVASGLAAAHERGLIHRDIKPGNIWLEKGSGRVKILDFGLVRGPVDEREMTLAGAVMGTPGYMAPEQARGETVDRSCDLFSLGCVLYVAATGVKPFADDAASMQSDFATRNPIEPATLDPTIPRALSDLIIRLIAPDPRQRPISAEAVIALLEEPAPTRLRLNDRLPLPLLIPGSLLAAAVISIAVIIVGARRDGDPQPLEKHEWKQTAELPSTAFTPETTKNAGLNEKTSVKLEVTDIIVKKDASDQFCTLDFRLLNRGAKTVSVSRVQFEVVSFSKRYVKDYVNPSAGYAHDISELLKNGDKSELDVSHALAGEEADRFEIKLTARKLAIGLLCSWTLKPILITSDGPVVGPNVKVRLLSSANPIAAPKLKPKTKANP